MNRTFHLTTQLGDDLVCAEYDFLVVAHGYESRAIAVAGQIGERVASRFALGFNHNQVEAFEANGEWLAREGFEVLSSLSDSLFADALQSLLSRIADFATQGAATPRIAIDISCFDRFRLAEVVRSLSVLARTCPIDVTYWYCVAKFAPPNPAEGRNEVAGPIHRKFAGRFVDPGRPLALVAGLGYELGKVMGAAEYLQAARVIALFPKSPIAEYEPEVLHGNKLLIDDMASRDVIPYPVDDPQRTISTLDAILRGLLETYNVVLLPGGPKIFVLASLMAQMLYPQVSVWRVSSGTSIRPRDVQPSSVFVGLRWQSMPDSDKAP